MTRLHARCLFSKPLIPLLGMRPGPRAIPFIPLLCACLLVTSAQCASSHDSALSIKLHESVAVSSPVITIGLLAEIAGPRETVNRIKQLALGASPLPGRSRRISRGYIKMRLRAAGIDPDKIAFTGPDYVLISRLSSPKTAKNAPQTAPKPPSTASNHTPHLPPDIRRGQVLVVKARYGLVEVTAEAVAMESGRVGEVIRVQVRGGRGRVLVRLTGPHSAEVVR